MSADRLLDVVLGGSNMDLRPGADGPGIIAFLIVAALVVACVFLYRSMRKQIGRIRFDPPASPSAPDEPPERSAGSEPT